MGKTKRGPRGPRVSWTKREMATLKRTVRTAASVNSGLEQAARESGRSIESVRSFYYNHRLHNSRGSRSRIVAPGIGTKRIVAKIKGMRIHGKKLIIEIA